ncbi:MAG: hypothetical protein BM563_07140 [Bacteroidetes bacterium MedPE-SWsnd-G1]|uniref:DUF6526 family protein n=1 Tax=Urechidicola vernalis TaxID=3075600 RepID=A0ABU2Y336_9FLAO|nr:DUF6526 family protein [Urechidicola sp. P050]MDT0552622.1 DUF6526 family protein [Urechidicola sp. P050]OIQ37930.1 MAG: hypothetical protein BM563_07140 [Bacteroidetes bacterium MedPE-SWsnd-G1]
MKKQNFKNHSRLVPGYHFLGGTLLLLLFVGSVVNLIVGNSENLYNATLLVLISILLVIVAFYARVFALKAQDRAIKAEENFRHYILTGTPLSKDLRMRQIIALRFASDSEFQELAKLSVTDNLSEKEIKKRIKDWKPNTYRV